MKTKEKQEIIGAVIGEQFSDIDDEIIRILDAIVTLKKGGGNDADEIRAIKIKRDPDGKVSAESFKIYNMMEVSFEDLVQSLLEEADTIVDEVSCGDGDITYTLIRSLLCLVIKFVPNLTYTFTEEDAKILFIIWQQEGKEVTASELPNAYEQHFGQTISADRISHSMEEFSELKVLEYRGNGKYLAREKMTYERN